MEISSSQRSPSHRGRVSRAKAGFSLGIVLLVLAWIAATPPGSAPDEDAHYVKALGAGAGEFLGDPIATGPAERRGYDRGQIAGAWLSRNTREFTVPKGLLPSFGCFDIFVQPSSDVPASCRSTEDGLPGSPLVAARLTPGSGDARERSYVGTYPPFVYVLPGAAMRAASDDAYAAFKVGRGVSAALCLALLLVAVTATWDPRSGAISLAGLMVALTPGALFIVSTLTPSGPEVAAGVCFIACLLRLTRETPVPGWIWLACAGSGGILMISRPLGVLFAPFALGGVALLCGRGRVTRAWREGGRLALGAGIAVAAAGVVGAYWQLAHQPDPDWDVAGLWGALGPSLTNLPTVLREEVGLFAAFFPAPSFLYVPWALLMAALLVVALAVADSRQRWGLVWISLGTVLLTVCLSVLHRRTGFDQFSGRYILPVFVLLPLGAGEVLRRQRDRLTVLSPTALVAALAAAVGILQALAWWSVARRTAVGTDGPLLFTSSEFEPPGGWLPWMLTVLVGALAYAAAGAPRADSRPRP